MRRLQGRSTVRLSLHRPPVLHVEPRRHMRGRNYRPQARKAVELPWLPPSETIDRSGWFGPPLDHRMDGE